MSDCPSLKVTVYPWGDLAATKQGPCEECGQKGLDWSILSLWGEAPPELGQVQEEGREKLTALVTPVQ